jgi:hypothetical protein
MLASRSRAFTIIRLPGIINENCRDGGGGWGAGQTFGRAYGPGQIAFVSLGAARRLPTVQYSIFVSLPPRPFERYFLKTGGQQ